jgi:hypothetical protein
VPVVWPELVVSPVLLLAVVKYPEASPHPAEEVCTDVVWSVELKEVPEERLEPVVEEA